MNRKKILISSSRTLLTILMCVSIFTTVLPTASAGKRPPANPSMIIELSVFDGDQWVDADSATGPNLLSESDPVEFKIHVQNTGNVDLSKISIATTSSGTVTTMRKMAVGETWDSTYSIPWGSGQQTYSATVEYVYHGKSYSVSDSAYYYGLVPAPEIQVVKTANLGLAVVGETVTYTFTVTNPGNVPLDTVSVVDDVAGSATLLSGDTVNTGYLDHGETWVYTATHTVESAPDPLVNTVTATGYYDSTQYSDTDTYSLDVIEPAPTPFMLRSPLVTSGDVDSWCEDFGYSVAIGGGIIAVSSPYDQLDDTAELCTPGYVYVFDAATRDLITTLSSPHPALDGEFGHTLVVTGDYLLVGAPLEDAGGPEDCEYGAAYVYYLEDLTAQPLELFSPTPSNYGEFGTALATDGTKVYVGAPYEDVGEVNGAGAVHIFDLSDGSHVDTLNQTTPGNSAYYGTRIVIYDTKLYISADGAFDIVYTNQHCGAVYVYDLETNSLETTIYSPEVRTSGMFGYSLAVTDGYIIVGAVWEDDWESGTGLAKQGLVHIFNEEYEEVATIKSPNSKASGYFGSAMATDGTNLVISAYGEGIPEQSGKAYVYSLSDIYDTPIILTSTNPEPYGWFGDWQSVAISEGTIVIGAQNEADSGIYVYNNAGHAYIFNVTP